MAEYKADFIKIPTDKTNGFQTMPVEPHKRLKDEEIRIEICEEKDSERIAEGLYTCFPEAFWSKMEPLAIRADHTTRQKRLAKRIHPSFTNPNMKWVKAVHAPTNIIVGIAGWMAPGNPIHNVWRRSAVEFYGWQEKMGWSDEEIEEMWKGTDLETWEGLLKRDDDDREELMGDEPHWFLAPLLTWPEFQGRGVGSRLMDWAVSIADMGEPPVPLYLESAPTARAVYMHYGFVPQGPRNLVRRGPKVVRGLEAEEDGKDGPEKMVVHIVEKETESELAH